jgi:hypothetical protein
MKKFPPLKKLLFIIPVILALLICAVLISLNFSLVKANVENLLLEKGILKKSTVYMYIDNHNLKIKFNITPQDVVSANSFAQALTGTNTWLSGMALALDESTLTKLSPLLPLVLNLSFSGNSLSFSSNQKSVLDSALPENHYQFATGSANLSLDGNSVSNFNLKIDNPSPLLLYATSSGKLVLSSKLDGLFPILQSLSTINIKAKGQNVRGEIILKD